MNYKLLYDKIIENAKLNKNREFKSEEFFEMHHIIPRCIGGNDNDNNLVKLTLREHFICHKLLCLIYPDNKKLLYAFNAFHMNKNKINIVNSSMYAKLREDYIRNCDSGMNHPMYGKNHSEYSRSCMSKNHKGKPLSEKNRIGISKALKGRKFTEEHRKHISEARTGIKISDEARKNMSLCKLGEKNPFYGKHHTEENKENLSKKFTGISRGEEFSRKMSEVTSGEKNPFYGKSHTEESKLRNSMSNKRTIFKKYIIKHNNNHSGDFNKCSICSEIKEKYFNQLKDFYKDLFNSNGDVIYENII